MAHVLQYAHHLHTTIQLHKHASNVHHSVVHAMVLDMTNVYHVYLHLYCMLILVSMHVLPTMCRLYLHV